jgi:hypothetical protein
MLVSMAIAGPAGAAFGLAAVFLVPRFDRDELTNPLDHPATDETALVRGLSGSTQNESKGSER